MWDQPAASPGDEVEVQMYTHFVGDVSEIKLRVHNKSGKKLDEITGKVYGNLFKGTYTVSDKAKEAIYFEAELKKHKLKQKSEEMKRKLSNCSNERKDVNRDRKQVEFGVGARGGIELANSAKSEGSINAGKSRFSMVVKCQAWAEIQ